MIFGSVPFSWCNLECDRRKTSEIDPFKTQWFQSRVHTPTQNVVWKQRRNDLFAGKNPASIASICQSSDPRLEPMKNRERYAYLSDLTRLCRVDGTLVRGPLDPDHTGLNQISDLKSINLRSAQPAENNQIEPKPFSLVENRPCP